LASGRRRAATGISAARTGRRRRARRPCPSRGPP
jgi:hypothetical protein